MFKAIKNDTQMQKYKYANTSYDEVPERPNMWYIFEKRIIQGYQKYIPMSQTCKYN